MNRLRVLNANVIKILAAIFMVIDHVGLLFFKGDTVFRHLGRLALPLFAFCIAEGCIHTKNKKKHFLLIFLLGIICQIGLNIVSPKLIEINILLVFSLSVLMIYSLQDFKKKLFDEKVCLLDKIGSGLLFLGIIALAYLLNSIGSINGVKFEFEYGFWGCMLPVFGAVLDFTGIKLPKKIKWLDCYYLRLLFFAIGLILLCLLFKVKLNMWYSLLALGVLVFYNGKRGHFNLKYFFYVFYPLHILILYGIAMLV